MSAFAPIAIGATADKAASTDNASARVDVTWESEAEKLLAALENIIA
jgi:hypothetical protein